MSMNIWEKIFDYDPNGVLVVNENLRVEAVNSGFINMFKLNGTDVIGRAVNDFFDDIDDFVDFTIGKIKNKKQIKEYPEKSIILSEVMFRIDNENLIVKIFHDITLQEKNEKEMKNLKIQVIGELEKIVDKQMKVGQEIASILGETTGETKASLVKLLEILKKEDR
ncbi:PAS domain-containing protein [Haliovirga abyssi]|uniref:PAS domain-containing protein n=1 Tax=Haliovirga abyssi TaxID=2996794 RepID=A0AAU9DX91_9FUSO|nr:PAS domain-containing protein [Haliovirga abyssi]BDU51031.1 hypothetical protein HLVA_16000 [Haliovirga abyssi]